MIEANQLTKYFDDFLAVDHVTFKVPESKVLVFESIEIENKRRKNFFCQIILFFICILGLK